MTMKIVTSQGTLCVDCRRKTDTYSRKIPKIMEMSRG